MPPHGVVDLLPGSELAQPPLLIEAAQDAPDQFLTSSGQYIAYVNVKEP